MFYFVPSIIKDQQHNLELAEVIGKNAFLEVLVHSLGGVVGEVLLEVCFLEEVVAILHTMHDVGCFNEPLLHRKGSWLFFDRSFPHGWLATHHVESGSC